MNDVAQGRGRVGPAAAVLACAALGACAAAVPSAMSSPLDRAWADVAKLTSDAACSSDAHCHSIGVGSKACGGPSGYLAWSSQRSDGAALAAAVQRHAAMAAAVQQRDGRTSTCAVEPDPGAVCTGNAPTRRCELLQR